MLTEKSMICYDPDAAGGGAPSGNTGTSEGFDMGGTDAGSGDGAEVGQEQADDYSDLAADERVQAYLQKQYGHIPEEHRSPDGFKQLLGARDQAQTLQQQLAQMQQQAQGQQQQGGQTKQEQAFHEAILAGLVKGGHTLTPPVQRLFGDMLKSVHENMTKHFETNYFNPLRDAMVNQRLESEYQQASSLPGFQQNRADIVKVVQQFGVPWDAAYKMVMYDKQKNSQKAGGTVVPPQGGTNGSSGRNGSEKRTSDGDRPSGAASSGGKMPKYKTPDQARSGAAAALRARGIRIEE